MMWLWMLLACQRAPQPEGLLAGCDDADCEIARALAAWPDDPETVIATVQSHPMPEARIAITSALIAAHPGETAGLCDAMPPGDAQDRCAQMNQRPHLWQAVRPTSAGGVRPGGGPSSNEVAPATPIQTALSEVPAGEHSCDGAPDRNGCLTAAAQAAAGQLQARAAAASCQNITAGRWRGECFFQSAEAVLQSRGPHGYSDAVELCAAATPFSQNCHSHAIMRLAEGAPAADNMAPEAWASVIMGAQSIRTAWSWRDPYMAEIAEDRLWSEAIGRAYAGVHQVTGDPLVALPEQAHRHVRAAAVRALIAQDGPQAHDLAGWVTAAREALAQRSTRRPRRTETPFRSAPELWPADQSDEAQRPATAYLGTARRTHTDDVDLDLAICVLEAVARTPPIHAPLMAEGAAHTDDDVRWTAQRLSEMRSPPGD